MSKDSQDDLSSLVGQELPQDGRLPKGMQWRAARLFVAAAALLAALTGLLLAFSIQPGEMLGGVLPPATALLAATLGLLSWWRLPAAQAGRAVALMLGLTLALAVEVAISRQQGLHAHSLGLMGLMVGQTVT